MWSNKNNNLYQISKFLDGLNVWTRQKQPQQKDLMKGRKVQRCNRGKKYINTSYMTDSYFGFTLNMESGQNFGSNRSIRSSTYSKKNIFEIPPCGKVVIFVTEFLIFLKTSK